MHNYSSAKLELLVLKWVVTEKFCDYLLGSKFHVYTYNSPMAYVSESKLGASQIGWLSELTLFDFTIHYQTGRSNRAIDALSRHPHTKEEINRERVALTVMRLKSSHTHQSLRWLMSTLIPPRYLMTLKKKHYQLAALYNQLWRKKMQRKFKGCSNLHLSSIR